MSRKLYRTVTYTSPNQAWTVGGKTKLDFTGFVEVASGGKRVIIDGFELHFQGMISSIDDMNGTSLLAPDCWRAFRNVTVEQKDGVKRCDEIDGGSLRVLNYQLLTAPRVRECSDIAVTNGGEEGDVPIQVTFSAYVPMRKPNTSHPYDFSMPADVMRQVRIAMAQDADMSLGTNAVTIHSGIYWVTAVCHLEPKAKVYSVDTVTVMDFKTQKQTDINCSGRPHDLIMYAPGLQGGLAIANVTDALVVDIYDQSRLVYPDLVVDYAREQENQPGLFATTDQSPVKTDPFVPDPADSAGATGAPNPRAIALLLSTGNHPDEGPVRENLTVKTNQSSDIGVPFRLIMREVVPRTAKITAAQAQKFGANSMAPDRNPAEKTVAAKDSAYFPHVLSK